MANYSNADALMKAMRRKLEEATGEVPITEMLNEKFMEDHTKFVNAQQFFDAFPVKFKTKEEWEAIESRVKDDFVREHTDFESWSEMIKTAGTNYIKSKFN